MLPRIRDLVAPGDGFIWATGVEDTFVPQTRTGHRALDEYELIGHYQHWREDLTLAAEVGVKAVRLGIPWYRVEPSQGDFDWSWTDQVVPFLTQELGIAPIVDLMHYGCPLWLRREFASDTYPRLVATYAAAFARRYSRLVHWYTPLNEPLINALMCGRRGVWPPYLRGDRGYVRIVLQLVKGIQRTVDEIKQIDPEAVMVHVEATGLVRTDRADLRTLMEEEQVQYFLVYDLLAGRVTPDHCLFSWLVRNGAPPDELAGIRSHTIALDVLGVNFYPGWSTKLMSIGRTGKLSIRATEHDGAGFGELLDMYYDRYRAPIMVTETSAAGSDAIRSAWLARSLESVREARSRGVPVIGYTWFPCFTMIDWPYRFGRRPALDYRLELGLYTLNDAGSNSRWSKTPLAGELSATIRDSRAVVGPLA